MNTTNERNPMSDVSTAARVKELERAVEVLVAEVKADIALDEARCEKDKSDECFSKFVDAFIKWEQAADAREKDPIAGPLVRANP